MKTGRTVVGIAALATAVLAAVALAAPGELQFIDEEVDGVDGVNGVAAAYGVAVSPDNDHVYVLGRDDSAIATFRRAGNGTLEFVEVDIDGANGVSGLAAPSSLVISRDGRFVYVTSDTDDTLVTFKRNRTSGRLKYLRKLTDGVGPTDGLEGACCQIDISPNGRTLYVAAESENAVGVFRVNRDTGRLRFLQKLQDGVGKVKGLEDVIGVVVSPDNTNVYATANDDSTLVSFKRKRSGRLRFMNVRRDGVGGVELLEPCCSLDISPNGRTVYVPAETDGSISVFKRARRTGKLSYLASFSNGEGGITDMTDPIDVVVSPDNDHVYVTGYNDSSVISFRRKPTGRLEFLSALVDGDGSITALDGAWRIAISPNGKSVYAGAYDAAGAVVAFKRLP